MYATQILTIEEIRTIVKKLHIRWPKKIFMLDTTIFRMACCCGLRRSEIAGIDIGDIILEGPRPVIRVRAEITKGRKGKKRQRVVPLWWDAGTKRDIEAWMIRRLCEDGAGPDDPFLCCLYKGVVGNRMTPAKVALRWKYTMKRYLGAQRASQLSVHSGRHTFCSLALAVGKGIVEVRDAAGHANISTTNIYVHAVEQDTPDVFS